MSVGFKSRYLDVMLEAEDDVVDKRFAAVTEIASALSMSNIVSLVELLLVADRENSFTLVVLDACEKHDASFLRNGRNREVRALALEVALAAIEGKPNHVTDALSLVTVTASWQGAFRDDLNLLLEQATAYLRLRQVSIRQAGGSPGSRPMNSTRPRLKKAELQTRTLRLPSANFSLSSTL